MSKLLTKKYQNKNTSSSAYGKYYGRIIHTETLTTDEFANHICNHGSPFDRSTIIGVLAAACDCLVELTLDSKRVRLGDLGTFYMSAETRGSPRRRISQLVASERCIFVFGQTRSVHTHWTPCLCANRLRSPIFHIWEVRIHQTVTIP